MCQVEACVEQADIWPQNTKRFYKSKTSASQLLSSVPAQVLATLLKVLEGLRGCGRIFHEQVCSCLSVTKTTRTVKLGVLLAFLNKVLALVT